MNKCLKICFMRILRNSKTYGCMAGMTLSLIISGIGVIRMNIGSISINDIVLHSTTSGFIILFYLLCVLGGGLNLCEDYNSGFVKFVISRDHVKDYVKAELISSMISGVLSMLLSLIVFEVIMIMILMGMGSSLQDIVFSNGAYFISNIWSILIFSLLGGVLSCASVTITTFIPNVFVGCSAPILLFYMLITITQKYVANISILPACVYFGRYELFGNHALHWIYALGYSGCIIYILYRISYWKILRRLEDV